MISIKELSEISENKAVFLISIMSFTIFPPFLFTFYIDKELFIQMDFWKLFLLTSGFGFLTSSISYFAGLIETVINYKDRSLGKHESMYIGLSSLAIIISNNMIFLWTLLLAGSTSLKLDINSVDKGAIIFLIIIPISSFLWILTRRLVKNLLKG